MSAIAAGITIASVAGLAWLFGRKGKKKGGQTPADHREPWTVPLLWDPSTLEPNAVAEICRIGGPLTRDAVAKLGPNPSPDAAMTAAAEIVEQLLPGVWASLFPLIAWPVLEGDHHTVRAAERYVLELVGEYLQDPAVFCLPDLKPIVVPPVKPDAPDLPDLKPIRNLEELEDPYPTPGRFYQVQSGDQFGGTDPESSIVYRTLLSAAWMAAKNLGGYDDAAAGAYAQAFAKSNAGRAIYRRQILCVPFNDQNYGTYGFGDKALAGPHGRSIRLLRYHANNRARLRDGYPAMRMIKLGTVTDQGKGNATGSGTSYEYLWLPAINLQRLWAGGPIEDRLVSTGLTWEDGSSQANPPPEIRTAVELLPQLPGSQKWGCP